MHAPVIGLEPASDDDAGELADLRVLAMRESLERVGRFDARRVRQRFLSGFSASHTRYVHFEGRRVGFVVVRAHEDDLLLDHLYVTPDAQGRGVGGAVLRVIFAEADSQGKSLQLLFSESACC